MKVAVIKYRAGNIRSVYFALKRLNIEPIITDDAATIRAADYVIFPGVGAARPAMDDLKESGLIHVIPELTRPFLGVCLGLQLLCRSTQEEEVRGLGLYGLEVIRFPSTGKVPHMGWNTIHDLQGPLFKNIIEGAYVYFVHSFYAPLTENQTVAVCDYLVPFSAALQQDNFFAVQFHPEKSGLVGETILRNFLNL